MYLNKEQKFSCISIAFKHFSHVLLAQMLRKNDPVLQLIIVAKTMGLEQHCSLIITKHNLSN